MQASGGKTRYGHTGSAINQHLKWALLEAANGILMNAGRRPHAHVIRLYQRMKAKRGHQKAVGAVARHLAEATLGLDQAATVSGTGIVHGGTSALCS